MRVVEQSRPHPRLMSSGVLPSVFVRLALASLVPHCHRSRPKGAKTRLPGPGLDTRFLAFLSGEGGIRTPGTSKRHKGFRDRCILSHAFPADLNEAHASRALPRVFNCPRSHSGSTWTHLRVEMAQEWHNRTAESVADRAFPGAGREARVVAVSEADDQSAATHTMARWWPSPFKEA